jgi:hypothetical protein
MQTFFHINTVCALCCTADILKFKLKLIYDQQSVGRPSGGHNQFFFLLEISFRQLRLCCFVAPSLTRGRVCNLLYNCFWALPELSLLGRSPAELNGHILLSHLRLPQPGGPGPCIYIPHKQGGPWALGSLYVASYDSQGCGGGILIRLHTGR